VVNREIAALNIQACLTKEMTEVICWSREKKIQTVFLSHPKNEQQTA
jgi:hypothetical protein